MPIGGILRSRSEIRSAESLLIRRRIFLRLKISWVAGMPPVTRPSALNAMNIQEPRVKAKTTPMARGSNAVVKVNQGLLVADVGRNVVTGGGQGGCACVTASGVRGRAGQRRNVVSPNTNSSPRLRNCGSPFPCWSGSAGTPAALTNSIDVWSTMMSAWCLDIAGSNTCRSQSFRPIE